MMTANMKSIQRTNMMMTESAVAGIGLSQVEMSAQSPWHWQQHSFRAMNTDVYVWRYGRDDATVKDVERLFAHYERHLSRFDVEAELAQFNRSNLERQPVSQTLFDAIAVAQQAARATDGLYDPTILRDLEQVGYDRSFEQIVDSTSGGEAQGNTMSETRHSILDVRLDAQTREARKPAGLGLDLGGMGKGWTVDRAAESLIGDGPFLVNAGGDLYAYGAPGFADGWGIELEHPLNASQTLARISLRDRALATSSTTKRRWQRQGQAMHHLIDPRSGKPALSDTLSVSVIADRTVLAEIYAKVALILGAEQGLAYLQSLPGVAGMLFTDDGRTLSTDEFSSFLT